MNNFLFSINVTLPIFLVMVLGWILRQTGMLDEAFVSTANKFNFKVTLPVLLYRDLSTTDIRSDFDWKFVVFCALATTGCFWIIWLLVKLFLRDRSMRGAFVQAAFRSSVAVMGMAFIGNIYGSSAMGPLMLIGAVPLYNIYAVLVLTFEAQPDPGQQGTESRKTDAGKIRQALINIIKNPIIIGILVGTAAAYFRVDLPVIADKTIDSVARLATPLALISLGAGFEGRKALAKIRPTLWASAIKLVVQPMVLIPAAAAMGFRGEKMLAILIMLASPATPSCYIMAKNMKNDGILTASIVVMTTLLAAFTLTGWIWLLKSMNLL